MNHIVIKIIAIKAERTPSHCPRVRRSLRNIQASMTVTPEKRELNTEATSSRPDCPASTKNTFPPTSKIPLRIRNVQADLSSTLSEVRLTSMYAAIRMEPPVRDASMGQTLAPVTVDSCMKMKYKPNP